MSPQVFSKSGPLAIVLVAPDAGIGLLVGVNPLMLDQSGALLEPLATFITTKGAFAGMGEVVPLEGRHPTKALPALLTAVWRLPGVSP